VNREGVQKCTPTGFRSEPGGGSEVNPEQGIEQGINREANSTPMRTSGNSSANAAVASAQAQTPYPDDFDQSLFDEAETRAHVSISLVFERGRGREDPAYTAPDKNRVKCIEEQSGRVFRKARRPVFRTD